MWLALYFGKGESTIIAENYGKRRNAVSKPCETGRRYKVGKETIHQRGEKSSKGPTRYFDAK